MSLRTKRYLRLGICGSNLVRHTNWLELMQLQQKIILIPSSIAICERGIFKQNAIKSHVCNKLNLKTLDALMGSLFVALKWTQWFGLACLTFGETCETKDTYTRLIDFFETNQDCILIIQNIKFSRILCNPKLR